MEVASNVRPSLSSNTPTIVQRKAQRGDVRAEAAGSLVFSTLAAGVAAYYLSRQMDTVEEVRNQRKRE